MSKQRISNIAKHLLENDNRFSERGGYVAYGDLDLLHEIFDMSGLKVKISHPLNKIQVVLNALDRESKHDDALFTKSYFRCMRGKARMFILKTK